MSTHRGRPPRRRSVAPVSIPTSTCTLIRCEEKDIGRSRTPPAWRRSKEGWATARPCIDTLGVGDVGASALSRKLSTLRPSHSACSCLGPPARRSDARAIDARRLSAPTSCTCRCGLTSALRRGVACDFTGRARASRLNARDLKGRRALRGSSKRLQLPRDWCRQSLHSDPAAASAGDGYQDPAWPTHPTHSCG